MLPFVLQSLFNERRKIPKRGSLGDVQFESDGFAAIYLDLRNNAFGLFCVSVLGQDNAHAALCHIDGRALANTFVSTGYHRDFRVFLLDFVMCIDNAGSDSAGRNEALGAMDERGCHWPRFPTPHRLRLYGADGVFSA